MKSISRLRRLFEVLIVLRRYGLDELLDKYRYPRLARKLLYFVPGPSIAVKQLSRGERLRQALQTLGPIFVKFGQLLSMRADLLSQDYINELQALQDRVKPFSGQLAKDIVEKSLDQPFDEVFSSFNTVALASASVAQVHEAELVDGTKVVVKVLRPNVAAEVQRDVDLMYLVAAVVTWIWPETKIFRVSELIRHGENALKDSFDLVIEAANASRFRANFVDDDSIYVPRVYWDYTSTEVMVMEFVEGIRLSDVDQLKTAGIDLHGLAVHLVELFCKQIFRDGYFHGDFHPGNVFVGMSGQFRVVDYGIMGTITDADRSLIADLLVGLTHRDYRAVAEAGIRSGWTSATASPEALELKIRAVSEPVFDKSVEDIPVGWVLGRLFTILQEFDINIQPHLILLQHCMASIEGEVRLIYPELKLSQSLRPHLERWVVERHSVGAIAQRFRDELPHWVAHSHEMPRLFHEVLVNAREQQIRNLDLRGEELTFRKLETVYRRIFFGVIGLVVGTYGVIKWDTDGLSSIVVLFLLVAFGCLFGAAPRIPTRNRR